MQKTEDKALISGDTELEFVCACLAHQLISSRPFPQPPPDINWNRLQELLNRNRLAAHFYTLSEKYRKDWPPSLCGQLRLDRYAFRLYGGKCAARVKEVLSAFTNSSIQVIVLKGWALIPTIYGGDYSQRFCEDIDVLIHPRDIDSAESILLSLGYVGADETHPGYSRRYTGLRPYFLISQPRIYERLFAIGLHWGLIHVPSYDPSRIDIASLFKTAQSLQVEGVNVLTLSAEDQLVYSCAHLDLHHRYDQVLLRLYETASVLLKANSSLNWDRVVERARAWRCLIPLKRVLNRVETLWPGVVPPLVLGKLEKITPTWFERFVDKWIELTKGRNTLMSVLNWLTMPSPGEFIKRAVQDIFPSREYMQHRYGNPPGGLWPLLYFRRYLRALHLLAKT